MPCAASSARKRSLAYWTPRRSAAATPGASAATAADGHLQGLDDKGRLQRGREGPSQDALAPCVDDHRQVEPAGSCGQVGDVGLPDLVANGDGFELGEVIGGDRAVMVALGGFRAEGAALPALQRVFAHQPGHARLAHGFTLLAQFDGHARVAVGLPRGREGAPNVREQLAIAPLAPVPVATGPGVIAPAGRGTLPWSRTTA